MIKQFNDLAANERTYLAWLRTALALIAFGFVLERFDLFLELFAKSGADSLMTHGNALGRETGVLLVTIGMLLIPFSTVRFASTVRRIRSVSQHPYDMRGVLIPGVVFFLLALFILLYVSRILTRS